MLKLVRFLMRPFCFHDWSKCYRLGITDEEGEVMGWFHGYFCKKCGKLHSADPYWLGIESFACKRDAYFLKKDSK